MILDIYFSKVGCRAVPATDEYDRTVHVSAQPDPHLPAGLITLMLGVLTNMLALSPYECKALGR